MAKQQGTILVVEDSMVNQVLYRRLLEKAFPEFEIACTADLVSAADILTNPDKHVVAAVIDNGFPLVPGGERKGKSRKESTPALDKEKLEQEGGAGTMLIRFIRTGKSGAMAESTLEEIEGLEKLGDPSKRYSQMPIVWNSALPERGKVAAVAAAAQGKPIDPRNPIFTDTGVDIAHKTVQELDDHTAATDKESGHAIVAHLEKQLAHQRLAFRETPLHSDAVSRTDKGFPRSGSGNGGTPPRP